jgi:hypothetical protein
MRSSRRSDAVKPFLRQCTSDDRPATHGLAERRDEAVTQTEGAQPGDIGDVALGPGARHFGHRPWRQAGGGDSRDAGLLERRHEVLAQGDVELLADELGSHPALRRQAGLSSVVAPGLLSVRQDPADDRQLAGTGREAWKGQRERLPRRPVRWPDVLLELLEEWVVTGGKAHQRRSECRLLLWHAEAVMRRAAEPSNRLDYPAGQTGAVGWQFPAHAFSLSCVMVGGSSHVA